MNVRTAAAGMAAIVALVACGGDDDTGSGAGTPDSTIEAPDPSTSPTGDGTGGAEPVATIAEELPEAFVEGVGPIAVVGDPLPEHSDGDDPAIGLAAPVIIGEDLSGEAVRIDAAVDGPTWLVFLAHWCPHCNDEIPVINELRDGGLVPEGVNVVGISTAASPDRPNWPPAAWLSEKDWTYPAILDGIDVQLGSFVAAEAFGLTAFPFSVLIDGDGTVVQRWSGGREVAELQSLLTNSLL